MYRRIFVAAPPKWLSSVQRQLKAMQRRSLAVPRPAQMQGMTEIDAWLERVQIACVTLALLGGRGACSRTVRALLECADLLLLLQGARSPRGAVGSAHLVVVLLDASCTLKSKHSVMVTSAPAMLAREINLGMHHSHVACQCVVA